MAIHLLHRHPGRRSQHHAEAASDLIAGELGLGYVLSAGIFGLTIAAVTVAYWRLNLNAVLAFWVAYVLTRPLGASIDDFLAQSQRRGGLGLSTTVTSAVCLATIVFIVLYFTLSRQRAGAPTDGPESDLSIAP